MKNKIIFLTIVALAAIGLQSCDKDTSGGLTHITYYPTITLLGDERVIINKGDPYVDAGIYAELFGKDVTDQFEVINEVNNEEYGVYPVTYKHTNTDGFTITASRTVFVADGAVTTDISGKYATTATSYREDLESGKEVTFDDKYEIEITKIAPGFFYVSDFFGGWYDQRAGYRALYGPISCMTGYIHLTTSDKIELVSSHVAGWGDSLDELESGTYDPNTGNIHWDVTYAGAYTWFIDFTKK